MRSYIDGIDDGVGANDSKDRFVFAKESEEEFAPLELDLEELYKKSLNTRDGMRELLQNAMDSALENLMSWERVARANGFGIVCFSDTGMGRPVPHFEDGKLSFVQRYGVLVKDLKVEGKGNKDK